jgi:hypothetical protein
MFASGLLWSPGLAAAAELQSRSKCSGDVPDCRTVQGGLTRVAPDSELQFKLTCQSRALFGAAAVRLQPRPLFP